MSYPVRLRLLPNVIKLRNTQLIIRAESLCYFSPMASEASPWVTVTEQNYGLKAQVNITCAFSALFRECPPNPTRCIGLK